MKYNLLLCLVIYYVTNTIHVDPKSSLFVDQYGRFTIYHGVNVVFKTQPFYPNLDHFSSNFSLTEQDLYNLKNWGMNMIRLYVAWQAVQPSKGVINYTYIEKLRDIIRMCDQYDIKVLLDAHQDLFSKKFCGEGFADWTVERNSFPSPLKIKMEFDKQGYPLRQYCLKVPFSQFYTTYDVMKLQSDFFQNKRGLLDHFSNMWGQVASYMSQQKGLLGYELINQPQGSSLYKNPFNSILPGISNNKYLLPAYKQIYKSIRKYDQNHMIFFEPSVIDVFGGGFYQTPGGQDQLNKQVFSYHVYCPLVTLEGQPKSNIFCSIFDQLTISSKEQDIKRLKIGGFMTQYGALSNTIKSANEVIRLTSQMSKYFRSWCYWQFKYYNDITTMANPGTTQSFYDNQGKLQTNKVKALSRPYAYAICGKPIQQLLNKKNGIFSLKWIAQGGSSCANKNTELFLSQSFYYQFGFTVQFKGCNSSCKLIAKSGTNINFYEIIIPIINYGKTITIIIKPL